MQIKTDIFKKKLLYTMRIKCEMNVYIFGAFNGIIHLLSYIFLYFFISNFGSI